MKRLTKIGLMLLAVLAMIIGTAAPVSAAGYDNYVYASSGSTVRVSITSEYRPYVKFTLTKACDVRVRSRAELNDGWNQFLNLYIYNSSGIRQAHWEQAFSSSTDMAAIDRTISLSAGTYYIWQSTRWSATGGVVAQGTASVTLNYPLVPQPTVTVKSVFGGKSVTFNCSNKNAYIYYELGTSSIGTASKHVKAGETVFFSKHVDGACDIEPIGNLYKTQVFELSKFMDIPDEIITKPPRAGLWENQTDEDEIGMSYELLDKILYSYVEKENETDEIAESFDISIDDVDMIINKIKRNAHKSKVPESPEITIL